MKLKLILFLSSFSLLEATAANFDERLVEVMSYCWRQKFEGYLNRIPQTFDFENYLNWISVERERDLALLQPMSSSTSNSLPDSRVYENSGNKNLKKLHIFAQNPYFLDQAYRSLVGIPIINGLTVAHVAVLHDNPQALEVINYYDKMILKMCLESTQSTPLHLAVLFRSFKCTQWLLKNGADMFARDASGSNPLDLALLSGNAQLLKHFIELGSICNIEGVYHGLRKAAIISVRWGYLDVTAYLLQYAKSHISDLNTCTTLLHLACKYSNLEVVKAMRLSVKIVPCLKGFFPHFYAIMEDNLKVLPAFSDTEIASTRITGISFLDAAVYSKNSEILEQLVVLYGGSKQQLIHATFQSIRTGQRDMCALLLSHGVSLTDKFQNESLISYFLIFHLDELADWISLCPNMEWSGISMPGRTLPAYAVANGKVKLLRVLLEKRLNPRFVMDNGQYAIDYARSFSLTEIAALLEEYTN